MNQEIEMEAYIPPPPQKTQSQSNNDWNQYDVNPFSKQRNPFAPQKNQAPVPDATPATPPPPPKKPFVERLKERMPKSKEEVVDWMKNNKRKTAGIIGGFACCLLIVILLGVFIPLFMLLGISQKGNSKIEVYEFCGQTNPYQINIVMHNPSSATAHIDTFTLLVKHKLTQTTVLSTQVPKLKLKSGDNKINFASLVTIEDEYRLAKVLEEFFNGGIVNITLEAKLKLTALGMTFTVNQAFEIPLGEPDPTIPPSYYNLTSVNFTDASSPLYLLTQLNISYTTFSDSFIAHLPALYLNVVYNQNISANSTLFPSVVQLGSSPLVADVQAFQGQLLPLQSAVNQYLNGNITLIQLTGTPNVSESCALQRIINQVVITTNLTSDGSSSLKVDALNIGNMTDTLNLGITYSTNTTIVGTVPNIEFLVTGENESHVLLDVDILAQLDSSLLDLTLSTNNPQELGVTLTKLVGDEGAKISIFGRGQDSSLLSQILNGLRIVYDNRNKSSSTSLPIVLKQITFLGSLPGDTTFFIAFNFSVDSRYVNGSVPQIFARINVPPFGDVANLTLQALKFSPYVTDHQAILGIKLNGTAAVAMVNSIFKGQIIALGLTGTKSNQTLAQRILQYFRYDIVFNTTQSAGGSKAVTGGVLPGVSIALGNSTPSTLQGTVSLKLDLPLTFTASLGNVFLQVVYQGSTVGLITYNKIILKKGTNDIAIQIVLTADYARAKMEDMISRYMFGGAMSLSLQGNITGPYGPTNVRYDIDLPANPGGDDTDVIKCVQMSSMSYSILDFVLGKCQLETLVDVFFHNPLPFPMILLNLDFYVYFDDPDGAQLLGITFYGAASNVLFSHVVEPGTGTPQLNPLPLALTPNTTGITTIRMNGFGDELCLRLYDQYMTDDQLTIAIRNGFAGIQIRSFRMSLGFSFEGMRILQSAPPCDRIALTGGKKRFESNQNIQPISIDSLGRLSHSSIIDESDYTLNFPLTNEIVSKIRQIRFKENY